MTKNKHHHYSSLFLLRVYQTQGYVVLVEIEQRRFLQSNRTKLLCAFSTCVLCVVFFFVCADSSLSAVIGKYLKSYQIACFVQQKIQYDFRNCSVIFFNKMLWNRPDACQMFWYPSGMFYIQNSWKWKMEKSFHCRPTSLGEIYSSTFRYYILHSNCMK